jgi:NDP-hexose 4,6-dehydratase
LKILVTGHSGFIGTNLCAHLSSLGHDLVLCSRRTGHDLSDAAVAQSVVRGVELVFHLAADARPAESLASPWETFLTNTLTTTNVALACRDAGTPMVYTSSCEIYGDWEGRITEETRFAPTNPYAASKAACDRLLYSFHHAYGLDVKLVRLFNPYGPGQQLNKILPTFYYQAKKNGPLTVFGDGNDTRDYVFIGDIVKGIWEGRRLPPGEAVNLATGVATTSNAVAKLMIERLHSSSKIMRTPYPKLFGGIKYQQGSFAKAEKLLGWKPAISFETGVNKTIQWLESLKADST